MNLLELLSEELPKRGGWPSWAGSAIQYYEFGSIQDPKIVFGEGRTRDDFGLRGLGSFKCKQLATDHATRIVTREEYEGAMCRTPTRANVLASLVGNLKQWPTEITDDLPHFIGWAWQTDGNEVNLCHSFEHHIGEDEWFCTVHKKVDSPATAVQPAPSGSGDPILGMVLADLTNRALEGKAKYGEPLKARNGRNALWDAYQEALDMCMYLRQAIEEQEGK